MGGRGVVGLCFGSLVESGEAERGHVILPAADIKRDQQQQMLYSATCSSG